MGAFIVHPKTVLNEKEQEECVLLLNDWQHFHSSEQHYLLIESGPVYPNNLESLAQCNTINYFEAIDGSRAAEALVTSTLINGCDRYIDPHHRTESSSTTPFEYLKTFCPMKYLYFSNNGHYQHWSIFRNDSYRRRS